MYLYLYLFIYIYIYTHIHNYRYVYGHTYHVVLKGMFPWRARYPFMRGWRNTVEIVMLC